MTVQTSLWSVNLAKVLEHGSKSIRWQLNLFTEDTETQYPQGRPLRDAGSTMDAAMRAAHRAAKSAKGTIVLHASRMVEDENRQWHCGAIGPVAEFKRVT